MASTRAPAVAEVLWELKKADKVASFTDVGNRAGFSAGANGRAMLTCMKTIRRDWPHLQWWRAIHDNNTVKTDGEQARELVEWGAELTDAKEEGRSTVVIDESKFMKWEDPEAEAVASGEDAEGK